MRGNIAGHEPEYASRRGANIEKDFRDSLAAREGKLEERGEREGAGERREGPWESSSPLVSQCTTEEI